MTSNEQRQQLDSSEPSVRKEPTPSASPPKVTMTSNEQRQQLDSSEPSVRKEPTPSASPPKVTMTSNEQRQQLDSSEPSVHKEPKPSASPPKVTMTSNEQRQQLDSSESSVRKEPTPSASPPKVTMTSNEQRQQLDSSEPSVSKEPVNTSSVNTFQVKSTNLQQPQLDEYEYSQLKNVTWNDAKLIYSKSLSLSDLTDDCVNEISKLRSNSAPLLLNIIEKDKIIPMSCHEPSTDLEILQESNNKSEAMNCQNVPQSQSSSIFSIGGPNLTKKKPNAGFMDFQKIPRSLSLSDLTIDCPKILKTRSSSAAPDVEFIEYGGRASPSLLLPRFTSSDDEDADPSYFQNLSNNNDSDGEYYGNMDEGQKRHHLARKDEWSKNKAKHKRMLGEEYLGYRKAPNEPLQQDQIRPARELGETCTSNYCKKSKFRGCDQFDEDTRKRLHYYFWKNLTWNERKIYVRGLVIRRPTTRHTKRDTESRRAVTFNYFLKKENVGKIQVCKNMFMSTLSLKSTTIQDWAKNQDLNVSQENVETDDKREKREKTKVFDDFLEALAKMPSHYARKETRKLYLEPSYRTVSDVYKAYKEHCSEIDKPSASRYTFDKMFDSKKLSLYTLKKDMCDVCVAYNEGNFDKHAYQEHIIKKNRAREEKETDKNKAATGDFILDGLGGS
ncbi:hypothetical protein O0L34_g17804 [Tuta absoluta]|nr:hypothetical protein O0L34_g17804 [Tuta absoluta]